MKYRGRFAPSPTGALHFGSLVAAVASWLDARAARGQWLLRIEDVDSPRTVPGAADAILRALEALGLHWDGPVAWQSKRTDRYEAALSRLREHGEVYRCRCTRKEIADSGIEGVEAIVYPGTCRSLGLGPEVAGADRMRTDDEPITFVDRVQGEISQRLATDVGDFVLRRRDALFAYQLAVVVDDAEEGITDVVRGADLLPSTARQIHLQRALGHPTPRYLHVPIATRGGQKLSKQTLAQALNPDSAAQALALALEFLGQEVPARDRPERMLAVAASTWNAGRIPRLRARELVPAH